MQRVLIPGIEDLNRDLHNRNTSAGMQMNRYALFTIERLYT
jgi:hypothetical protein